MRVRRSLLNFGTMLLYTAVTTAVALKTTPYLQAWLGGQRFGAVRVVNDAYGYLMLLELGLGGALGPLLARALATNDDRATAATLSAGLRGYLRVAVGAVVLGACLTPFVPALARDLNGPDVADLRRAWLVGLAGFFALVLLPMRSLLDARQLGYVVNLLLTVQATVVAAVALILAWAGWGITGQAVAALAGTWAFNLVLAGLVARSYPGLLRAALTTPPDRETRLAVRGLSWPNLLLNLSGRVSILTDNLVVGALLGASRVNSLFNTQRLALLGQTLLQSVGNAAWAGMAELHAQGLRDVFNRRVVELTRLVGLLCLVGFVPVVAYNRAFVRLWLGLDGPNFTYGGDLLIVLAVYNAYMVAVQSMWSWCFTATGRVARVVPVGVTAAALNLPASLAFTYAFGLPGPLVGTAVAVTAVGLWVLPRMLGQDFGTPPAEVAKAVAVPLAWGVVLSAGLWWLARTYEPANWATLIAAMCLSSLVCLAVGVAGVMTPADRALWWGRLRQLRPAPRPRSVGTDAP